MDNHIAFWDGKIKMWKEAIDDCRSDMIKANKLFSDNIHEYTDGKEEFIGYGNGQQYSYRKWSDWFRGELVKAEEQHKRFKRLKDLDQKIVTMEYIGQQRHKKSANMYLEQFAGYFKDENDCLKRVKISMADVDDLFTKAYQYFLMSKFYGWSYKEQVHHGDYVSWETLRNARDEDLVINEDVEEQYSSVGFDPNKKKYLLYKADQSGVEEMEEEECAGIVGEQLMKQIKHHCQEFKTFDLKIGNPKTVTANLEDPTKPVIHYQQGEKYYCLGCSLASALHHKGFCGAASYFYTHSKALSDCIDPVEKLTSMVKSCMEDFRVVKIATKTSEFDLLGKKNIHNNICLMVLLADDGGCQHAITTVDNCIFDSNRQYAMDLNRKNLDWCCSSDIQKSIFVRVHWAVGLFHMPDILSQGKVSNIINSMSSLFQLMKCFTAKKI